MEPDLDQLRLQQLLQPFNNQTGVMNTTSASPFKIGLSNTLTQYNVPGLRSQNLQEDLVQQMISENQAKANPFVRPNMLDIAGGIVPGGITEITPSNINLQKLNSLGFGTNYGVANTPDVIGQQSGVDVYEYDDGTPYYIDPGTGKKIVAPGTVEAYKKQSGYYGKEPSGIAKLFEFLGNIPTPFNLIKRGLESLSGLNQRLRNTDFGRSKTLMDYLDMKKYGGYEGREAARQATMAQARGLQKQMAQRASAQPTVRDRAMGGDRGLSPSRSAAATRSRDLGSMRGGVGR